MYNNNAQTNRLTTVSLPLTTCGIIIQGSAQDYLEVVKMGSDKHTYNIFQSNNNIKCIVVVWSRIFSTGQKWSVVVNCNVQLVISYQNRPL